MALLYSTQSELGSLAHPFSLPVADGSVVGGSKIVSLDTFKNSKTLLIVFICNHCPYVIAVQDRINQITKDYASQGVAVLAISSNDPHYKIDDSFENMKLHSKKHGFVFPYAFDETQEVARAYDAVCTPDPYLYENVNGEFRLRYRGRIDDAWKDENQVKEKSMRLAIEAILSGQPVAKEQVPAMGCSIKWKELT